jgi:hypothetical protein
MQLILMGSQFIQYNTSQEMRLKIRNLIFKSQSFKRKKKTYNRMSMLLNYYGTVTLYYPEL